MRFDINMSKLNALLSNISEKQIAQIGFKYGYDYIVLYCVDEYWIQLIYSEIALQKLNGQMSFLAILFILDWVLNNDLWQ